MKVETVKKLRVVLDGLFNSVDQCGSSRELALAKTNLERGKMFLGKVLGGLKEPNPYPESTNPDSQKIEPTADRSVKVTLNGNDISKVKALRGFLDSVTDELVDIGAGNTGDRLTDMYGNAAILAIEEGKMWLGAELGRINNSKDSDSSDKKMSEKKSEETPAADKPSDKEDKPSLLDKAKEKLTGKKHKNK